MSSFKCTAQCRSGGQLWTILNHTEPPQITPNHPELHWPTPNHPEPSWTFPNHTQLLEVEERWCASFCSLASSSVRPVLRPLHRDVPFNSCADVSLWTKRQTWAHVHPESKNKVNVSFNGMFSLHDCPADRSNLEHRNTKLKENSRLVHSENPQRHKDTITSVRIHRSIRATSESISLFSSFYISVL